MVDEISRGLKKSPKKSLSSTYFSLYTVLKMKIQPTNMNGFETYDDEPYFSEGIPNHVPVTNGAVEEYTPPVQDSDFSEYMWMENEEEFDKEVMQRLEEEELMEQCMLQHMMEDDRTSQPASATPEANDLSNSTSNKTEASDMAKSSTLNPHAAEFVPSWGRPANVDAKST